MTFQEFYTEKASFIGQLVLVPYYAECALLKDIINSDLNGDSDDDFTFIYQFGHKTSQYDSLINFTPLKDVIDKDEYNNMVRDWNLSYHIFGEMSAK
jgi:hypothetical protein